MYEFLRGKGALYLPTLAKRQTRNAAFRGALKQQSLTLKRFLELFPARFELRTQLRQTTVKARVGHFGEAA